MSGAQAPIYLLEKAADTPAAGATRQPRDYARHWTPVHLDVVVDDVDAAVTRAVAAGARLEPGRHACLGPHRPPERPVRPWHLPAAVPGPGLRRTGRTGAALPGRVRSRFRGPAGIAHRRHARKPGAAGPFRPERARSRLRATFRPEYTRAIELEGKRVGFYALRPDGDGLRLDHLYLHPSSQARGLGGRTLRRLLAQADAQGLPLRVGALRGSDSNRFYQRHGFVQIEESEWDIEYLRPAQAKTGANASKPCDGGFAATQCRPALRHGQSKVGREEDPTKINATTQQDRPNRGRADPAPPVRSRRPWGSAQRFGTSTF